MKQNELLLRHSFRSYSLKMMANYLMSFMGSIIDGIVISRFLGVDAMAAFQIVAPLIALCAMLSMTFSMGLQTLVSGCLGGGRMEEAKSYYTTTMIGLLPVALLFALGVYFLAEPLVALLGASGESAYLADEAAAYLHGVAPAFGLIIFMPSITSILFMEGNSKYSMISIGCQLVINIVGDFTNAFYLHWGLLGMGLATSLCNIVGVGVMLYGKVTLKGGIGFTCIGLSFRKFLSVLSIGVPSALSELYYSIQTLVVNHILLLVSTGTAVAAFGIVSSVESIFSPILFGVATTALTIGGLFHGERDKDGLCRLFRGSLMNAVVAGILIVPVVYLTAPLLVQLFMDSDSPAFDKSVHVLCIYVLIFPFYGINKMLQDFYLGCDSIRLTYLTTLLENLVCIILAVSVLGYFFGEDGVWFGFVVGEALATLCTYLFVAIAKKRIPRTAEDMLFLPEVFDQVRNTALEWSVTTSEDMKETSREAKAFMLEHGSDEKKADLMAEYIEEIGGIVTLWGADSGKRYYADFRLVGEPESDKWTIRVRDNSKQFDLQKWQTVHSDVEQKNYAIRTVDQMAKDSNFSYTLEMNYLFLTL